jgi:hypothetical protein
MGLRGLEDSDRFVVVTTSWPLTHSTSVTTVTSPAGHQKTIDAEPSANHSQTMVPGGTWLERLTL